jgi:5,6-dimethylbenzimidazole synthase
MSSASPAFDNAFREQLLELFRWRRDVRRFRAEKIPQSTLEDLLKIADFAPSVGLSQPWRFVIVNDPVRRAAVRKNFETSNACALANQEAGRAALYARLKLAGLDEAPCHFAVFADPDPEQGGCLGRVTMPETTAYSAVLAVHTLWLAARAMGLGLGWISILDPVAAAAALEVPSCWTFIGYFCLGYPRVEDDVPELKIEGWEHLRPTAIKLMQR